jgi:hypothetical protein
MQANQQVTFLSDGADTVRDLQLYMNPNAQHILDWFHITMRLTVMRQMAKGLGPPGFELRDLALKQLERSGSYGMATHFVHYKPWRISLWTSMQRIQHQNSESC